MGWKFKCTNCGAETNDINDIYYSGHEMWECKKCGGWNVNMEHIPNLLKGESNMNLIWVTWDGDLTHFLVNADTSEDAIKYAIEANVRIGMENPENDEYFDEDIHNPNTYICEDVDGMEYLFMICQRNDWMFCTEHAIAFCGE